MWLVLLSQWKDCVSYPGRYESVEITLVGKTYQRIVQYDAARLKTAFNVVEKLIETLDLLKRSTDITM